MIEFEKHCWAEVDLDALTHNFRYIRSQVGDTPICGVVKADAYGHGDVAVAKTLAREGAAWFAVSCLREGIHLRRNGITQPIILLGYVEPEYAPVMALEGITAALPSLEWARAASRVCHGASCKLGCHIKLDTGMGRIGFPLRGDFDGAIAEAVEASRLPNICVIGAFQHFSVADCDDDVQRAYTEEQHRLFLDGVAALREKGVKLTTIHCCNSAGQLLHPEWGGDLVRAGIILYGANPSDEVTFPALRQVMALKTVVTHIKTVDEGRSVSYGRTWKAPGTRVIATLAAGYADGYPRLLSSKGVVTIHGQAAPIVGRVCMDQCMVDVTDIPDVKMGDEVTLFGPGVPGDDIEAVACKTGLITYEVLSQINRRVPRVYMENGAVVSVLDYLEER